MAAGGPGNAGRSRAPGALSVELEMPPGFPTGVFVEERPRAELLPAGAWTLLGDEAVREGWLRSGLPDPPDALWVPVREEQKRLGTLVPWLEHWAERPLHRDATVVAVGGGALLDMAGLAAALFLRGVAWQAWPTTLLAQADAGLGGKTAVDLEAGKNLAGAFHPPARLVACRAFLESLPERQMRAGRWEMVKVALLEGDLDWAGALLDRNLPERADIARCLRFKGAIVHRDPRERGERRLLNLGHTLGHALEAASGYRLLHGEAVGLGLLAACELARDQGLEPLPGAFLERLAGELRPLAPRIPAWEECLPWLLRDKKADAMAIHCILPLPRALAEQRILPAEAWAVAHARMLAFFA